MSDTNNSDDNGGRKQRQNQIRSLKSAVVTSNTNLPKDQAAHLTSDIMELISEEELSICRSEGSPPRKKTKSRKIAGDNAVVEMTKESSKTRGNGKIGAGLASKKAAGQKSGSANFRIRPER